MAQFTRRDFLKFAGLTAAGVALPKIGVGENIAEAAEVQFVDGGKTVEQIFNPYLPLNTYIPDGEPHVFGDRVYIFGSHDQPNGTQYCEDHYQVWSAPVNNLHDWKRERSASYLRDADSSNAAGDKNLWAPDVTQGKDGKYYLIYCFDFWAEFGVAVSDKPEGPYKFLGHIHYPDGRILSEHFPFDPAFLTDDDGRIFMYYGFAPAKEKAMPEITPEMVKDFPPDVQERYLKLVWGENCMVVELESDYLTVKEGPKAVLPGGNHTDGTGFEDHGYFEAPSMRKFNGKYYFVYSSHKSHELCYATSDYPDKDFKFGGIIVSNGDIGYKGRTMPVYPLGNNHGGLVKIGNDYYIFYHRQTNGTEFSRQGCAEKVTIKPDGSIDQVEITSCGLNGAPLLTTGSYPAAIACHLTDEYTTNEIKYFDSDDAPMKLHVHVTENMNQIFITKVKGGATVGYKYFDWQGVKKISLEVRGNFRGEVEVTQSLDGAAIGKQRVNLSTGSWNILDVAVKPQSGTHALYFKFTGTGSADFKTFIFGK